MWDTPKDNESTDKLCECYCDKEEGEEIQNFEDVICMCLPVPPYYRSSRRHGNFVAGKNRQRDSLILRVIIICCRSAAWEVHHHSLLIGVFFVSPFDQIF